MVSSLAVFCSCFCTRRKECLILICDIRMSGIQFVFMVNIFEYNGCCILDTCHIKNECHIYCSVFSFRSKGCFRNDLISIFVLYFFSGLFRHQCADYFVLFTRFQILVGYRIDHSCNLFVSFTILVCLFIYFIRSVFGTSLLIDCRSLHFWDKDCLTLIVDILMGCRWNSFFFSIVSNEIYFLEYNKFLSIEIFCWEGRKFHIYRSLACIFPERIIIRNTALFCTFFFYRKFRLACNILSVCCNGFSCLFVHEYGFYNISLA